MHPEQQFAQAGLAVGLQNARAANVAPVQPEQPLMAEILQRLGVLAENLALAETRLESTRDRVFGPSLTGLATGFAGVGIGDDFAAAVRDRMSGLEALARRINGLTDELGGRL